MLTFSKTAYSTIGTTYSGALKSYPEHFKKIKNKWYISDQYLDAKERWRKLSDYTYDILDYFEERVIIKRLSTMTGYSRENCRTQWNNLFGERKLFFFKTLPFIEAVEQLYKETNK